MSAEEWRVIPGHPKYEVSSAGKVRSNQGLAPRILKTHLAGAGYEYVGLGSSYRSSVHVLVAETFIGPRPAGNDVRHLDGDKLNNHVDNLAYGTRSQNMRDALAHGRNYEASRTHCNKGHAFEGDNLLFRASGARRCRECSRATSLAYVRRVRAEARAAA